MELGLFLLVHCRHNYQGRLCYRIPQMQGVRVSSMFVKIEAVRSAFDIECYHIRHLGMDTVFKNLIKKQNRPADVVEEPAVGDVNVTDADQTGPGT